MKENAAAGATGAHSVAAVPTQLLKSVKRKQGSLFNGGVVNSEEEELKRTRMLRRLGIVKESLGVDLGRTDFDAADVVSRIDAAAKKADQNEDTTAFGLEDEDGNMVKVYVRNDQSEEFEKELSALLAGADEDDDQENSSPEIAEVLFKLKDKFDIVDVEWPGIEGDEEEEQEAGGGEERQGAEGPDAAAGDMDAGDMGAEGGDMDALEGEPGKPGAEGDEMMPDEDDAKSALNQVIDMMKADAEAKKAEADARAAEARAKEAEYSAQAAGARVRKEEQIFDMEAAEKQKSEQEKEAKQLAKLARFQHQNAQDAEVKLSMESEEESDDFFDMPYKTNYKDEDDCDEVTMKELSNLIMRNLRHNS